MKVKVTIYSHYCYIDRECTLIVDFRDNLERFASFISFAHQQNIDMSMLYLSSRQHSRIVGTPFRITIDKIIN